MNILILSDSHGHMEPVVKAIERAKPDAVIHLGDYYGDGLRIGRLYPHLPLYQVPGNCDMVAGVPREMIVTLAGHDIFLCHGDRYGVKNSMSGLRELLGRVRVELLLFGHTHIPFIENRGDVMLVNPGSIGRPRQAGAYSCAVAVLEEGRAPCVSLKRLDNW